MSSPHTSKPCASSTVATYRPATAASRSPTRSTRSSSAPRVTGRGSGSSPPRNSFPIPAPATSAATTSTSPPRSAQSRRRRRGPEAGHDPHLPPLVRHPPAGSRHRHPHGPGAARSPRPQDDDDLHPRHKERPLRSQEPSGPALIRYPATSNADINNCNEAPPARNLVLPGGIPSERHPSPSGYRCRYAPEEREYTRRRLFTS